MGKTTFELINELIIATSHILWPILIFIALLVFKKQLIELLTRLKKGKIGGQEFEFTEKIDAFEKNVKEAELGIPEEDPTSKTNSEEVDILAASSNDSKIGIMLLAREIEKEIRILLASLGVLKGKNYRTIYQAFEMLGRRDPFPRHTMESVKVFWGLRNEIVHGKMIKNESNIIRVLDIGMTLLSKLKAIPHEVNIIHHPGVDIFSDLDCTQKIEGVKGLILETTSSGGVEKKLRIYPTTRTNYEKGKRVAWEWDLSKIWGESWYIHPDNQKKLYAWTSSTEFVGRHIDEL